MATLPRYERMGVQYADLPRVSTAAQQAAAEGFSRASQAIDRMVSFMQGEMETRAKREAKKYAIENPLTKEQIDKAAETGAGLQVPGAGEVFQRTYEDMQASMLSSQLQVQAQNNFNQTLSEVKAGKAVDPAQFLAQAKDMIDGYATAVAALDPEESVRLRARLTTAGNVVYQETSSLMIKRAQTLMDSQYQLDAEGTSPLIESLVQTDGLIDPRTGLPIDSDAAIQTMGKPYLDLIKVTGNAKPWEAFQANVRAARIDASVSLITETSETGLDALKRWDDARGGRDTNPVLNKLYAKLNQTERDTVRKRVRDYFVDRTAAERTQQDIENEKRKKAANALEVELIDSKTLPDRKQTIVSELVMTGFMTPESAREWLKPPSPKADVVLELRLMDEVTRGQIQSLNELMQYRGKLTDEQFLRVGKYAHDQNYRRAQDMLKNQAGIVGFELNPSEAKIQKLVALQEAFAAAIEKGLTPMAAAREATGVYQSDENIKAYDALRDRVSTKVSEILEGAGFAMPQDVSIEEIDLGALRDGRSRPISEALRKKLQTELDKLTRRR